MVVAAPRVANCVRAGSLAQRRDRLRGRDARNGFDQLADLGAGEREVAVPAAVDDGDETRVDEPGKVVARRGRRDAGLGREHARRERAAVAEREQNPRPGRLGEQRADGCEVGVADRLRAFIPAMVVP